MFYTQVCKHMSNSLTISRVKLAWTERGNTRGNEVSIIYMHTFRLSKFVSVRVQYTRRRFITSTTERRPINGNGQLRTFRPRSPRTSM